MKYLIRLTLLFFITFHLFAVEKSFTVTSEENTFVTKELLQDLNHPWSMAFLPDSEGILITERPGFLSLFKNNELIKIEGLPPLYAIGQGGLLDVIIDPDFRTNRQIYFSFSESDKNKYGTAVARAILNGTSLSDVKIIFRADPKSSGGIHFGSRLLFGSDGFLYITLGERGNMANAQDLNHHGGSVIRIDKDGNIPSDNPFNAIYTYGHRNSQGIALNKETGELWLHEHGPKGGDEVNILKSGANYGWPLVTYGINYNGSTISGETTAPGIEEPVIYWTPSIAPSGMSFYYGSIFPEWSGNIFVGALAGKHLRRLVVSGTEIIHQEILLKNKIGRVRDVRTGPDGYIYILTDETKGSLYRLEPVSD